MDIRLEVSGFLSEKEGDGKGQPSFSRMLPFLLFGVLLALGIVAFVLNARQVVEWEQVRGSLEWLRNLAFASILPYMTNRLKGKQGG